MNRTTSIVAVVAAIALLGASLASYRVLAAERSDLDDLRRRLDEVERTTVTTPAADPDVGDEELRALLVGIQGRLTRLEGDVRRSPVEPEARPALSDAITESPAPAETAGVDPSERLELEGLLERLVGANWDFSGRREDYEKFLELARGSDVLDELIDDLETRVSAYPDDIEARMQLSDVYVGKLMTAAGPEQGLWGGRAEEQWRAVVDLNDDHLRAHSSLGTNFSYYPEVMDKTDDAIHHLQRAREIQRNEDPDPGHVQTYLFLARMYVRDGRTQEARDVLTEGLARHPSHASLREALDKLD